MIATHYYALQATSLNSKIVSQYSSILAPIAVDAVKRVADLETSSVDLKNIRIIKKVGGTIEDTSLVDGMVLRQSVTNSQGGPSRKEKAKIGLIQFQLSTPKPDMDNEINVTRYGQLDKILKEERQYLLEICKTISKNRMQRVANSKVNSPRCAKRDRCLFPRQI
ncbi:T-complex protein 1 subunit delta [Puccinia graminis f. sp. tritici]|uniref:T-complex protein 1 subunit delta n=1 Tax=Puccinia graminis f. sp. tritici TaxID=56615 RepID=A0A5B0MY67_PUCGR|nr:T-complex protein 1 subunit delta [Puccinia graminis f. sp. tritici]